MKNIGYTGDEDRPSKREVIFKDGTPIKIAETEARTVNQVESNGLHGSGLELIITSKPVDALTKLELLQGIKLSDHSNTLTEASNLRDEIYKRGETQNEKQYQNALDKFKN